MNSSPRSLEEALGKAIAENDPFSVKNLLKAGANLNHRFGPYKTISKLKHIWEVATQRITDTYLTPQYDYTMDPLQYAAACPENDPAIVRLLIRFGADVNSRDEGGRTPLIWAAEYSNIKAVKQLLDHGAEIDAQENDGTTALLTATNGNDVKLATVLLDRGANIELHDAEEWTPLLRAISVKSLPMVELLVSRGANVKARTSIDWSPLQLALHYKLPKIVQVLERAWAANR